MAAKLGRGMRRIVVDDQAYVWKFKQAEDQGWDAFRAYAADNRTHPQRVLFDGQSYSGSVGGVFIAGHPEAWDINLYTPAWAATFIRYGLTHGWQPHKATLCLQGADVLTTLDFKPTG